jgi:DNA-binding response OmpR family regulator
MSRPSAPSPARVLIVEDEIFVAADLEATLEELGYEPIGIAADRETAFALAHRSPDIALVDLNLRDGETGIEIGRRLGAAGVAVLFITANPRSLGRGIPGTLGVVSKPADSETIAQALDYICNRRGGSASAPPSALHAFT